MYTMYCIQIFAYVVGVIIHNQNFDKNFQKPNIPDKILAANSCWVWPEDLDFIGSIFIAFAPSSYPGGSNFIFFALA